MTMKLIDLGKYGIPVFIATEPTDFIGWEILEDNLMNDGNVSAIIQRINPDTHKTKKETKRLVVAAPGVFPATVLQMLPSKGSHDDSKN